MLDNSVPTSNGGSLSTYLSEINRYPVLKPDEEQALARQFRDQGDLIAGHRLVTANLRFVVKVAFEYRSYGLRMSDLIQEGNLGLMKAVQKFDPNKGIRLISYAVWWIRAFVQNHILQSWSLVKIGTTQAQRKLFFSLARTKREIERMTGEPVNDPRLVAKRLRVKTTEVIEMERRLDGRDLSLDAPLDEESGGSHIDLLPSAGGRHDEELADLQERKLIAAEVRQALETLQPRERFIIENRLLSETPMTYIEIGRHFGFSRERARQLELRARERLKAALARFRDTLDTDSAEAAHQWLQ